MSEADEAYGVSSKVCARPTIGDLLVISTTSGRFLRPYGIRRKWKVYNCSVIGFGHFMISEVE